MRKTVFAIAALSAAFLSACADSSERRANREYVGAALKVSEAERLFNEGRYKEARGLCAAAGKEIEEIVAANPESNVALKIVSDAGLLVGPCPYRKLKESVIPELDAIDNPAMAEVSQAWAIAVRSGAYPAFARAVIGNCKKFGGETSDKILAAALPKIADIRLRAELGAEFMAALEDKPAPAALKKSPEPQKPAAALDKKDQDKILQDAAGAAALVSFDIRQAGRLADIASRARELSAENAQKFSAELSRALDNALKISAPAAREQALAKLAEAFANSGDIPRAIAVSQKISTPALFYGVFKKIGSGARSGEHYREALTLAPRLPDAAERGEFVASIAEGVARQGLFDEARKTAKLVPEAAQRSAAFANLAKIALDAGDRAEAAACVSNIDASHLGCLSVFGGDPSWGVAALGMMLANLSRELAGADAKLAAALNALAAAEASRFASPPAALVSAVFANY
ncbi:MAG: hypothetical protein IJI37_06625, partial [Opitutales bacterium]|nr:hypothetical protein [Opitutales bacterium]